MFNIKPYDKSRPLAFMHIPKCAGSSFRISLMASQNPINIENLIDPLLFGNSNYLETIDKSVAQNIYFKEKKSPDNLDFLSGHLMHYTIKNYMPSAQIITILREPSCRILSHWLFWRRATDNTLGVLGSYAEVVKSARGGLYDFLNYDGVAPQIDNLITRMLLCPHPLIPHNNFIPFENDDALTSGAIEKLNEISWVGLVEDPEMVQQCANWLGKPMHEVRANETEAIPMNLKSPLHNCLHSGALDALAARSRIDNFIWDYISSKSVYSTSDLRMRTIIKNVSKFSELMSFKVSS